MAEQPETSAPQDIQNEIAALVRNELLRISAMQSFEEKLKIVVDKASKITPPPAAIEPPPDH